MISVNQLNGRRVPAILALALMASGVAGCGAKKPGPVSAGSTARQPVQDAAWGMERIKEAISLLNEGKSAEARVQLLHALNARPGDMIARSLLKQIDTDPKVLLGTEHHSYVLKEGDTMSGLAQRFLGDPLMSYALARYNGLASPTSISPGQSIIVPGKRKAAVAAVRKAPPPAAKKPSTASAAPAPVAAKPAPTGANPAQAARLRGQGLAAMNGGAINRAVVLFRQALAFDPANGLIKGDLARALRIQGTLKSRN